MCLSVVEVSKLELYGAQFRRTGGLAHQLYTTKSPSDTMYYNTVLTYSPHLKNISPHKMLDLLEILVTVKYPVSSH